MDREKVIELICQEFSAATADYGKFHSRHEAWAVLREEVDELWDVIKANGTNAELKEEAVQVGAMAFRLLVDCCYD